jgi:hypothetical protein
MSTEQPTPAAPTPPAPTASAPVAPAAPHATEPAAEPTALAQALTGGWEKFKQGQLISYPLMALVLLLVTGVGVTWWVVGERRKADAAKWVELDAAWGNPVALQEFVDKYADTPQAKVARLGIARARLGPEGIDRMTVTDAGERRKAVESVEKAREAFAQLADEYKNDPVIWPECLMSAAVAEAVLIGYPKEGPALNPLDPKPIEFRGDAKKVVEWLDKVIAAAPGTEWEKRAKKYADTLRNPKDEQDVRKVQAMVYDITPTLPGVGAPPGLGGLGGLGGLPGLGGSPFGP